MPEAGSKRKTKKTRKKTTKKSSDEVEVQLRREKVLDFILGGATVREIAKELEISPATVTRDKQATMRQLQADTKATAEEWRALEQARLNTLLMGVWPAAAAGGTFHVPLALKIMERMAKLWGYDSPERLQLSGPDGEPIQLQAVPPAELEGKSAEELAQLYFDKNAGKLSSK